MDLGILAAEGNRQAWLSLAALLDPDTRTGRLVLFMQRGATATSSRSVQIYHKGAYNDEVTNSFGAGGLLYDLTARAFGIARGNAGDEEPYTGIPYKWLFLLHEWLHAYRHGDLIGFDEHNPQQMSDWQIIVGIMQARSLTPADAGKFKWPRSQNRAFFELHQKEQKRVRETEWQSVVRRLLAYYQRRDGGEQPRISPVEFGELANVWNTFEDRGKPQRITPGHGAKATRMKEEKEAKKREEKRKSKEEKKEKMRPVPGVSPHLPTGDEEEEEAERREEEVEFLPVPREPGERTPSRRPRPPPPSPHLPVDEPPRRQQPRGGASSIPIVLGDSDDEEPPPSASPLFPPKEEERDDPATKFNPIPGDELEIEDLFDPEEVEREKRAREARGRPTSGQKRTLSPEEKEKESPPATRPRIDREEIALQEAALRKSERLQQRQAARKEAHELRQFLLEVGRHAEFLDDDYTDQFEMAMQSTLASTRHSNVRGLLNYRSRGGETAYIYRLRVLKQIGEDQQRLDAESDERLREAAADDLDESDDEAAARRTEDFPQSQEAIVMDDDDLLPLPPPEGEGDGDGNRYYFLARIKSHLATELLTATTGRCYACGAKDADHTDGIHLYCRHHHHKD